MSPSFIPFSIPLSAPSPITSLMLPKRLILPPLSYTHSSLSSPTNVLPPSISNIELQSSSSLTQLLPHITPISMVGPHNPIIPPLPSPIPSNFQHQPPIIDAPSLPPISSQVPFLLVFHISSHPCLSSIFPQIILHLQDIFITPIFIAV